jgi:hypothetical protein
LNGTDQKSLDSLSGKGVKGRHRGAKSIFLMWAAFAESIFWGGGHGPLKNLNRLVQCCAFFMTYVPPLWGVKPVAAI